VSASEVFGTQIIAAAVEQAPYGRQERCPAPLRESYASKVKKAADGRWCCPGRSKAENVCKISRLTGSSEKLHVAHCLKLIYQFQSL